MGTRFRGQQSARLSLNTKFSDQLRSDLLCILASCNLLLPVDLVATEKRLDLRGFSSVLIGPWAEQITPTLYRGLSATFYKHVCALCVLTQIPRVSCLRVQ